MLTCGQCKEQFEESDFLTTYRHKPLCPVCDQKIDWSKSTVIEVQKSPSKQHQ